MFERPPEQQVAGLDWYADFRSLAPLLKTVLQCSDDLLLLGPGTSSPLHEQLYDSGYRGLTVVDSDADVLAAIRQRSAAAGRTLTFQLADIVHGLAFDHTPFNTVIDKGTLDCVLAGPGGEAGARAALAHVHANLRSAGTFILVTHGPPAMRMPLLRSCAWDSIQVKAVLPAQLQLVAETCGDTLEVLQDVPADDSTADERASYVYVCRKTHA